MTTSSRCELVSCDEFELVRLENATRISVFYSRSGIEILDVLWHMWIWWTCIWKSSSAIITFLLERTRLSHPRRRKRSHKFLRILSASTRHRFVEDHDDIVCFCLCQLMGPTIYQRGIIKVDDLGWKQRLVFHSLVSRSDCFVCSLCDVLSLSFPFASADAVVSLSFSSSFASMKRSFQLRSRRQSESRYLHASSRVPNSLYSWRLEVVTNGTLLFGDAIRDDTVVVIVRRNA